MRAITRFDRAKNVYGGDIGTGESALVHHFFDARADRRNLRGEIGEAARPVANYCRKTRKSPVRHEPALDHPAEHVWIDVAAAEQEDDTLAREFGKLPGEAGCEGRRGGAFDYAFFQFDDAQDRERDLFLVHEHDLVGMLAGDFEGVAPDLGDGEAVRQSRPGLDQDRFSCAERRGKTGDVIGFDRNDLHFVDAKFSPRAKRPRANRHRPPAR